jgi:hypothetical protein
VGLCDVLLCMVVCGGVVVCDVCGVCVVVWRGGVCVCVCVCLCGLPCMF